MFIIRQGILVKYLREYSKYEKVREGVRRCEGEDSVYVSSRQLSPLIEWVSLAIVFSRLFV